MTVAQLLSELAAKHKLFGNVIRLAIVLALRVLDGANWSQLKRACERLLGVELNPNALAFHLKRLIAAGVVLKYELPEPEYRLNAEVVDRYLRLDEELLEKVREVLGECV